MKKIVIFFLLGFLLSCKKEVSTTINTVNNDPRQKRVGIYIGTANLHYLGSTATIPYTYKDTVFTDTFYVKIIESDTLKYAITIEPAKVPDGTWLRLDTTLTKFSFYYWGGGHSYGLSGYFTEGDSLYYSSSYYYFFPRNEYSFKGKKK